MSKHAKTVCCLLGFRKFRISPDEAKEGHFLIQSLYDPSRWRSIKHGFPSFSILSVMPTRPTKYNILVHTNPDKERFRAEMDASLGRTEMARKGDALLKRINWIGISQPFRNKCRFTSQRGSGNEHVVMFFKGTESPIETAIYAQIHKGSYILICIHT